LLYICTGVPPGTVVRIVLSFALRQTDYWNHSRYNELAAKDAYDD